MFIPSILENILASSYAESIVFIVLLLVCSQVTYR